MLTVIATELLIKSVQFIPPLGVRRSYHTIPELELTRE